jgi:hypothetical protein
MALRICLVLMALCLALPAHASGWLRAESEHHVVYADLDEEKLRELVQLMEDFRRMIRERLPPELTAGRKLHVYMGKGNDLDWARIERRVGALNSELEEANGGGLYFPNNPESLRHNPIFFSLAHYHMESAFLRSAPEWVTLGFAMVFRSTYPDTQGRLVVGGPDVTWPLRSPLNEAVIDERLTTPWPRDRVGRARNQVPDEMRQSREIMRQLLFNQRFAGQLEAYLDAYNEGQSLAEASRHISDRAALVEASAQFNATRRPPVKIIVLPPAPPAEIAVRPLGEDEAAVLFARFARIVGGGDARIIAERLQRETVRFPDSAPAWYEYAAAEFVRVQESDFGGTPLFRGMGFANGELVVSANRHPDSAAWAAVQRALALDPGHRPAQRLKAEMLMARLVREDVTDGAAEGFEDVRNLLLPIAADAEREPLAAALYHQSYVEQGVEPTDEAFDWLERAFLANAGIEELRYAYAVALSRRGERAQAERLLASLLNSTETGEAARRALEAAP